MSQAVGPPFLDLQAALQGRFAVGRLLGRGGMGLVFLAHDLALDRPVAIKLLDPALAANPRSRERFLREARAAARLSHPHIVPVHAVEDHGPLVCFIMGFVDGETLGQRVRRSGPLPAASALRLMREAVWALGHAHAVGLVHRDVKPENILLERHTGRALLTDFGIARMAADRSEGEPAGTPAYMSPEQALGTDADGRSDLYSLGLTLFVAVTGRMPFDGSADTALRVRLGRDPPPVASLRPDLPAALSRAIDQCLARDPGGRPRDAEALLDLLTVSSTALAESPPPVAAYVQEASRAFGDVGAVGVSAAAALVIYQLAFRDDMFAAIAFFPIIALLITLGLARFGELVLRTRTLLAQGYSREAILPAVEVERRQEEAAQTLDANRPRQLTDRPLVMALTGLAKTAACVWLATLQIDTLTLIGVVGSVVLPAFTVRQIWRQSHRARGLWARMLEGRLGRLLFRMAQVGNQPALPAPDAPTAVFLGDAAQRLFEALPLGQQREFAVLPDVVARLQQDAMASTDGRAKAAMAALDTLRLDLLRLQAGQIEADQLTRDLDAAREVGQAVERMLEENDPR